MRSQLDAYWAKKDSSLLDYFENIGRSRKLTPAVLAAALSASATETVLLNSERVEQQFGSYGIDVLASEAGLRRSSLYSSDDGERICRTYAVVRFTDQPDTSYSPEHAHVLAGNSLGEVFKANGWAIHKQTLHIGSFELEHPASEIGLLMKLDGRKTLALHIYQLLLARGDQAFEYATIIEAHHPAYLSAADLLDIYHYDESETLSADSIAKLVTLISSNDSE
jgi:hypothetical protein